MIRIILVLAIAAPSLLLAGRIQRVNLSPEEAQSYITQQSLDLRYAKKLGEHPLGYFRNIEDPEKAKFFHNGRLIDKPEDYVEEVYEANQFHGQDGLGRAMFGYTDYNQARLEARNANGEVRGSYQYIDPFGEEVIVQYWSDGLGFHQVDNRPEVRLEPVTETPEVREARIAHLKAWEEAAKLARSGGPSGVNYNKPVQNSVDDEEDEVVGALSNQHQSLVRYPTLPYSDHIAPEGAASDDAVVVEAVRSLKKRQNDEVGSADQQDDEPQYDPKGFFYSFEYPVYTISETEAAKSRTQKFKRSNPPAELQVESEPLVKTVAVEEPKPVLKSVAAPVVEPEPVEQPEDNRVSLKAIQTGEQLVAAVHDAQVSPKQKLNSEQ
uniref:Cuticle protein 6 n=1 Tax=Culex pipiens TaxID=7175 RepID=A0A8D8CD17_CULPI